MSLKTISMLLASAVLCGCASQRALESEVTSFSLWPAGRKPTSYAFERLPSQQSRIEQQQRLERFATPALEAAGFTPAADPKSADVTVQLGARITATERSPFDDPFWRGGWSRPFPYGRGGRPFFGPGWRYGPYGAYGSAFDHGYEREVALLIRDRADGQPLYEARAVSDAALPAMFAAALKDFPNAASKPHRVTVEAAR
jgi:hypothetical protein